MKKQLLFYSIGFIVLTIAAYYFGESVFSFGLAAVIPVATAGAEVKGEPVTNQTTDEGSEDLLQEAIDQEICKMRPSATPLDQITRMAKAKKVDSFEVGYYSVDIGNDKTTTTDAITEPTGESGGYATSKSAKMALEVADNSIFPITTTILVKGVKGYEDDGITESSDDLCLVVVGQDDSDNPIVIAANGKKIASGASSFQEGCIPSIPSGTEVFAMGRAAAELDVQTPQYSIIPTKETQFCQIFKMQIEQGTFNAISKKEAPWAFSDMEEAAVYKMREGIERSFLFGRKKKIPTSDRGFQYLTGGIWNMAGKEISYGTASSLQITEDEFVDISRAIFTGNNSSKRKLLFGGTEFIANISKVKIDGMRKEPKSTQLFGLNFTELETRFGTFLIYSYELLDRMGKGGYALVIDPAYIVKSNFFPWQRRNLSLKESGQRESDAVVLTEASCLYLKYPSAHARIVPYSAA